MGARRYLSGAMAVVGGLLMVGSGYVSRGFLYTALGLAEPRLASLLGGVEGSLVALAILAIEAVIALGGFAVAAGGLIILARHTTSGRVLIFLGGGAGFLGLLVSFGYSVYKLGGLDPVLSYLPYWLGLALAIAARKLAKGA